MAKKRSQAAYAAELPTSAQVLARLTGAKLCYGKPVSAAGRTIVTVASVRTAGGFGFGRSAGEEGDADGSGGGGGGALDARPVGFIEIDAAGARYHKIDDGRLPLAAIGGGAIAALLLTRRLSRRRRVGVPRARGAPRLGRARPAALTYSASQRS